mmetsp:Transcript_71863/g.193552  ORF Transcript_71863/g.193552 Transcript_71863/m.193552 type:complete len:232 (-) Transcript_71863:65-760(-)
MVDVPIDDECALRQAGALSLRHCQRHVAEHAEAHGALALRVVPRRPHHADAAPDVAAADGSDTLDDGACSKEAGLSGSWAEVDALVPPPELGRFLLCEGLDVEHGVDVLLRVLQQQLLSRSSATRYADAPICQARFLQALEDADDSGGPLRMPIVHQVVMLGHAFVVHQADASAVGRDGSWRLRWTWRQGAVAWSLRPAIHGRIPRRAADHQPSARRVLLLCPGSESCTSH